MTGVLSGTPVAELALALSDRWDAEICVEPVASLYTSAAPIHEIVVRRAGDEVERWIAKDLAIESLIEAARRVKDPNVHDRSREPAIYEVLDPLDIGLARWKATINDEAGPRWLVIEHIDGLRLEHCGELVIWESAARWLGRFQWCAPALGDLPLIRYDEFWFHAGGAHAAAHADRPVPRWLQDYEPIARELAGLSQSLVHGDYTASNVMSAPNRIVPLDWELAGLGTVMLDLASLVLGWRDEIVTRLVDAFEQASGVAVEQHELDLARLHRCVQGLAWSAETEKPEDERHRWFRAACDLAGRIGL